jgi:hypothetical protein
MLPSGSDAKDFSSAAAQSSSAALNDYLLTSGSSYPSILSQQTTLNPNTSLSAPTPTSISPQDSGFVSRSDSYSSRPHLDLVLPHHNPSTVSTINTTTTTRSGSLSPKNSSTNSPTNTPSKRRNSPVSNITSTSDFKKPRKTTTTSTPTSTERPTTHKSASHNDVEKRYRTNLNIKIAELSASVPSLRAAMPTSENVSGDEMDTDAVAIGGKPGYPARGLKKATILSRATEYIKSLEAEKRGLEEENKVLKRRLMLCGRIAGEEGLK